MPISLPPRNLQRRQRVITQLVGLVLLGILIVGDAAGLLEPLEWWFYDLRVQLFQRHFPKPTDQLVHLDIDDAALQAIGRWPWDRSVLAEVIDELALAEAKVVALDILFLEPQPPRYEKQADGTFTEIDHDAILAEALRNHGNTIIAIDPTLEKPVDVIRDAAADLGLVKYPRSSDGVARFVSLRSGPNANLADELPIAPHLRVTEPTTHLAALIAARMLDMHTIPVPHKRGVAFRNEKNETFLIPSQDIGSSDTSYARLYNDMLIPWFGKRGNDAWQTMYDWPEHRKTINHVSIAHLWNAVHARRTIERNNRLPWVSLHVLWQQFDPTRLPEIPPHDAPHDRRDAFIEETRQQLAPMIEWLKEDAQSQDNRNLLAAYEQISPQGLATINDANVKLQRQLDQWRVQYEDLFKDKAVLVGFTATAATYDEVTTPLHATAPGVVVHGTVFNAIMTGEYWQLQPWLWTLPATVLMGGLMILVVSQYGPVASVCAAIVLSGGYFLFNGMYLFDANNSIVGLGVPLLAITTVWASCTVFRFVFERVERARVTKRFRSYVDPALVDFLLEHPDENQLAGEQREMTVVFTDLEGFTTLSEKLREQVVPLLSKYLALMVPIVRQNRGIIDKFLGDGMMFFYGAPVKNENHAMDAVTTLQQMRAELERFNASLAEQSLPPLTMRAGVCSGLMVVGDAGPPQGCDYTVLGDTVNLAARLESANKITGTWTLINDTTRDLIADHYLGRPVARLQVKGKEESVLVYEPLCRIEDATDTQQRIAECTRAMVEPYLLGRYHECQAAIAQYEKECGPDKLSALYQRYCTRFLHEPPAASYDGRIELTEK